MVISTKPRQSLAKFICSEKIAKIQADYVKSRGRKKVACDKPLKKEEIPEYTVHEGLRFYRPYYFQHKCFAKGRWFNKDYATALGEEFHKDRGYYQKLLENGAITVNDKLAESGEKFKQNDTITVGVHSHESPTINLEKPMEMIYRSKDLIVVNKPSSLTCYPVGRYNFGSVTKYLRHVEGISPVYPVHRLDRQVSGVLILPRTKSLANYFSKQINKKSVTKIYLALVNGCFPDEATFNNKGVGKFLEGYPFSAITECDGKDSYTKFAKVFYFKKENRSLVLCIPITGRSHQIRVHLMDLGFPIVDDPYYQLNIWDNHELWSYSEKKAKVKDIIHNAVYKTKVPDVVIEDHSKHNDPDCTLCRDIGEPIENTCMSIYLHAYQYCGEEWDFKTEIPKWAGSVTEKMITEAIEKCKLTPSESIITTKSI